MERAALGVAACAALWAPQGPRSGLVLCGPGSNGGDGYAAARILAGWGFLIQAMDLAASPPPNPAARRMAEGCRRGPGVTSAHGDLARLDAALGSSGWVLDALFGVGLTRPLDAWWCAVIERVNGSGLPVLALDVPSGLDADRGVPRPVAVRAEVTATMVAPKIGLLSPHPGHVYAGRIVEIDIGLPWALHAPYLRGRR